jgi:alpha-1,3-mannosyltransferase
MRRQIGPVDIDVLDLDQAVETIVGKIAARSPTLVAFCNAHSVNIAATDPSFADVMKQALVLNDGIGLDVASSLLYGSRFPANLNGTDFVPALLAAAPPLRIYLLGSRASVAELAGATLGRRFPQHRIVGLHDGFFTDAEASAIREEIIAARPNLILVGMGQPRQEKWAALEYRNFGAVTMCIGAYLDFAAGAVPRAPALIRRLRMEWAFRLAHEPRRLAKRYLIGNFAFMFRVVRQRLAVGH